MGIFLKKCNVFVVYTEGSRDILKLAYLKYVTEE